MKILLQCPNCKAKSDLKVSGQKLSSQVMKNIFKNSNTFCQVCYKNGVGRITLQVTGFDWEKEGVTKSVSQVPTKLDVSKLSQEELERIKNREKELTLQNTFVENDQ